MHTITYAFVDSGIYIVHLILMIKVLEYITLVNILIAVLNVKTVHNISLERFWMLDCFSRWHLWWWFELETTILLYFPS